MPPPRSARGTTCRDGAAQRIRSEQGNPLVDMQTMTPTSRLDDPGIGLRDNGRRVLTYADLSSLFDDPDGREPGRTIELHLTGHMERFAWSFDGIKFSDAEPIRLTYGERVRIVLVNDTMMAHPIHLHGMWSDLEDDAGRLPRAQAHHRHAAGHAGAAIASRPTRSAAGRTTATCSSTWRRACCAKCGSRSERHEAEVRQVR